MFGVSANMSAVCEPWTINKHMKHRMEAAQMWLWRMMQDMQDNQKNKMKKCSEKIKRKKSLKSVTNTETKRI